jgi:hypothetical protein
MVLEDKIINCNKCGSDLAYINPLTLDISTTQCMGCGFYTHSLMKQGEKYFEEQMEVLPNLYKELMVEDEDGNIWVPSFIDTDEGMIFANGKGVLDWKWAAVKKVDIPEEDRSKYPIPNEEGKFYKRRTDMSTIKEFPEGEFMDALDHLNLLDVTP